MTTNWEDEFDLIDEPKKKKNNQQTKKKGTEDDDFFDLEDDNKGVKLPSLNSRTANKPVERDSKIKENVNLQEIKQKSNKKVEEKNQYQFEEEYEESVGQPEPQTTKYQTQPLKTTKQEEPKVSYQPPPKEEQEEVDAYGEQNFEEENYDEDFQENVVEKKPELAVEKVKETKKEVKRLGNIPKPAPSNKRGQGSVTKKQEVSSRVNSRANSRSSARSYDKRSAHSKTRVQQKKEDPNKDAPNKYMNFIQKHCPTYQKQSLQKFDLDKLTRQNQRVRTTIKKLNDELNDLINKNLMQLKGKKNQKESTPQDLLKQLQQIKSSNQTALQNTIRQLSKLKDKQGTLGEQEYHQTLDQNLLQAKNTINELNKTITKLNVGVDNEGKKLAKRDKIQKQNPNIQMGNIKISMINTQKDYDKHEEQLKKMEGKLEDLTRKVTQYDGKLTQNLDEAKRKGVLLITNPELYKKGQQYKKKMEAVRIYKNKTQGLYKTKCQMLNHENDQLRSQMRTLQSLTLNCHNNCEDMQNQSKKAVERAKRNGKITPQFINVLENIILEMERGVPGSQESSDQRFNLTNPNKGAKKYQSLKNVDKMTTQPQPKQIQKTQDDTSMKKPFMLKKKREEDDKMAKSQSTPQIQKKLGNKSQRQDERVWKQSNSPRKPQKSRDSAAQLATFQDKQEKKDEQKKKPFMIKKNRDKLVSQQHKQSPKTQVKPQIKQQKQQPKNEETINIAPRMMKFQRKQKQSVKEEVNDKNVAQTPVSAATPAAVEQKINVQEDDKPAFAPRRFNLKPKQRKSEDVGYALTIPDKKQAQKPQQQQKPKDLTLDKPEPISKQTQQSQAQKPKFNLKLKNRQKQNKNNEVKQQIEPVKQQISQQPQAKVMVSLNDQPKPSKQNSNPYAPANPYAQNYQNNNKKIKKEKEGPIKEHKPVQNAQKQKYDLFGQAEDLTNVQEIKNDSPKPAPSYAPSKPQNEELDLNALLGKPKQNKAKIDDDLLVDDAIFGKK